MHKDAFDSAWRCTKQVYLMNKCFYTILCLVIMTGCVTTQNNAPARINAISDTTYTETLNNMMAQLSEEEIFNFQIAMLKINLEGIGSAKEALNQRKLQVALTAMVLIIILKKNMWKPHQKKLKV